jgi:hypothetical protein
MTSARRRVATVAAVVLLPLGAWQVASYAAAGGNGQGNNGVGNGNGGPSSGNNSSPGKALTVSVVAKTPVAPGQAGSVTVKVTNPNNQAAVITSLGGSVTGVGSGTRTGLQACNKSWITLGSFAGSQPVGANSYTLVTVPVTFTNLASTNQDNCKGVTYTFSFTVNGRQA